MARWRVAMAVAGVLWAASVEAQPSEVTGLISGHLGVASGGDVRDKGLTLGALLAVVESNGWGAELDLSHARRFDDSRFAESGLTTLMLNVGWLEQREKVRPYAGVGAGLLRVRTSIADGVPVTSRTDWGFNAGGGVLIPVNDAVAVRGEVRYFRYFQRHADLPRLDNGFFDFWRTAVGITYSWPIR
ncbi:MAG: outer membrane protein [Acidobacteriota bacterium]